MMADVPQTAPQRKAVSVFVVDEHAVFCEALLASLKADPEVRVLGYETDFNAAGTRLLKLRPDVVLLDVKVPAGDGFTVLREGKSLLPATHFLVLSDEEDAARAVELVRAGASGVLLKDTSVDMVLKAVKRVAGGELWLNRRSMTALVRVLTSTRVQRVALTVREKEIIQAVAEGLSNKQIGARLFISEDTVKSHLKVIFRKLNLGSRTELALWALERGFTGPQ